MNANLVTIQDKYERIMHSDMTDDEKDEQLGVLMSLMEREYGIPALQNAEWEQNKISVITWRLSISRSTI